MGGRGSKESASNQGPMMGAIQPDSVLPAGFNAFYELLRTEHDYATRAMFYVMVGGRTKTGKSTLLNALAGRFLLPEGYAPSTAVVVVLQHDPEAAQTVLIDAELIFRIGLNREQIVIEEKNPPTITKLEDEILPFLERANQQAREERNESNRKDRMKIFLIMHKFPDFGQQKICFFDTPGTTEEGLHSIFLAYYCALLKSADLCLEVMDFMKPPNDIDQANSIRSFVMNIMLSNRTFANTKIVLNKCDDPNPTTKQIQMMELWKKQLVECAQDYLQLNVNEDVLPVSALNLFKYQYLHHYQRMTQEDEQYLARFPNERIKQVIVAANKEMWKQQSKGERLLTFLRTGCDLHAANRSSNLEGLTMRLQNMLNDCETAVTTLRADRIQRDKATIDECAIRVLRTPLTQLKDKFEELKNSPISDMSQVSMYGRAVWEKAKTLVDACEKFIDQASHTLICQTYLTEKWKHLKQQAFQLYNLFFGLDKSKSSNGFFAALFTAKGAMILVNLTYLARLSGYLATTWWCVPIFVGLVAVDTIVTMLFWWRSNREPAPRPVDSAYILWKNRIVEMGHQYNSFEEQFTSGVNDLILLQSLSDSDKIRAKAEIERLRVAIH